MVTNNIQLAVLTKRQRDQQRQQMAQAAHNAQATLNAILWLSIKRNAANAVVEEDEALDGNGETSPSLPIDGPVVLTLPISDLKKVPGNFGLTLQENDDDTISVIAILTKPKSNIILPGEG